MKLNKSDDQKIIITDSDGKTQEGRILFSFEENGDSYVIYEINQLAYGAKYNEQNELFAIEEDEWPLIEKIWDQYREEFLDIDFNKENK